MTTQILTSEQSPTGEQGSVKALGLTDTAGGLPDSAALEALANAFFQALPGQDVAADAVPLAQAKASLSQVKDPLAQAKSSLPQFKAPLAELKASLTQAQAPLTHANAHLSDADPLNAYPLNNAQAFGLPDDRQLAGFLREDLQFAGIATDSLTTAPVGGVSPDYHSAAPDPINRVVPQSFGLPGESELRQLLSENTTLLGTSAGPATAGSPAFYFLEYSTPGSSAPAPAKETGAAQGKATDASPRLDTSASGPARSFDVQAIRRDFPILADRVNGHPLVWFDNAATTHKPKSVIERISYFYEHENSNIHRAAHELAARATDAYEGARNTVARFLGAASADDIVFVRGTTEAINLIANTFGRQHIGEGDEIIVSNLEHHANIVPWYMLAQKVGAKIRVIPVDDTGQILLEEYRRLINSRTKLVAITQVANALGTVTPVKDVISIAHAAGVRVLVDGAQAVSHMTVNVQQLDADFYVFSGHKLFGPTGIGVIYGKPDLLASLGPWQGGGNMIADVTFDRVLYQPAPNRFEAGTGNIADAVGLGAAIDYLQKLGMDNIARYEHSLLEHATHGFRQIPGVRLIGTAEHKASVISFTLAGYTTEEVGTELNREGIAVRSGHHCAQPILRRFGVETTVRPSFAFYNTYEEIDRMLNLVERLARARRV